MWMPAKGNEGSTTSMARFVPSLRRSQVPAIESAEATSGLTMELEAFQNCAAERFTDLQSVNSECLLSMAWISKLLNVFIRCQEEFGVILMSNKDVASKSPLDRILHEYFERSVKALDVCNAIRDGINRVRDWNKLVEIVCDAFAAERTIGEGQFRRAKKALIEVSILMLDEKESAAVIAHRNRSFGREKTSSRDQLRVPGHARSLSWSVSRSWSASRQVQAIASNLMAPKSSEILLTNGVVVGVFTMNSLLLFLVWVLVAAIPCQDRGLQVHFSIPKSFPWATPLLALYDRVLEESKKRERRNTCGLLREIFLIDHSVRALIELGDSLQFPLMEEKEAEIRERVSGLEQVCQTLSHGLCPLEKQVREVFRSIVCCRTNGLELP